MTEIEKALQDVKVGDTITFIVSDDRPPKAGELYVLTDQRRIVYAHSDSYGSTHPILSLVPPDRVTIAPEPPTWPEWASDVIRMRVDELGPTSAAAVVGRYHWRTLKTAEWPHGPGTFRRGPNDEVIKE